MSIRTSFARVAVVVFSAVAALDAGSPSFRVNGAVHRPGIWSAQRLAFVLGYAAQNLEFKTRDGGTRKARALPLAALIQSAHPRLPSMTKRPELRFVVRIRSRDGLIATFSLAEIDPRVGKRDVWLVFEMDGKPLPDEDGPVRLVVPSEEDHARWLTAIEEVTVIDVAEAAIEGE